MSDFQEYNLIKGSGNDLFHYPAKQQGYPDSFNGVTTDRMEGREWMICRGEVYRATKSKLLLIHRQELELYTEGSLLYSSGLNTTGDIPKARGEIKKILDGLHLESARTMHWILVISELATNVIMHADKGKIKLYDSGDCFTCCVEDEGPGFNLNDLKDKTLAAGYSTKASLGMGFTIILKLADQVMLCNTEEGSAIIVKFYKSKGVAVY
ncbi:ATP-binding protein [Cytobacillus firmus]|uniref:Histidine kinase/HSP90-like ATPase domain-containing protein n=1 Tax=Cytobacillus firmus DS1 TaxID=1307436 RepID=W7L8F9_CYTFI|nr:ATP-binding protein [Cytobacillus firmus]EWG11547.1 hypothetical protein PBF_08343 [Cytobacillus firmus DS1]